jgi:putative ABC transport system substrate-binding protein
MQHLTAISTMEVETGYLRSSTSEVIELRRREFIAFVGGAVALPRAVAAQSAVKRALVFLLSTFPTGYIDSFLQALREHGRVDGQNVQVEIRILAGEAELSDVAEELVRLKPDVIVVTSYAAAVILKQVTATIPIVCTRIDLIDTELIASLARPGGNVTGLAFAAEGISAKLLQLLREMKPSLSRAGAIVVVSERMSAIHRRHAEAAAATLGVTLVAVEVRTRDDLDSAFGALTQARVEALLDLPSELIFTERNNIAARALAARLPSIFSVRPMVAAGGV